MIPNELEPQTGRKGIATRRRFLKHLGAATAISVGGLGIGSQPVVGQTSSTGDDEIEKTDTHIDSDGATIKLSLFEPTSGGSHPAVFVMQGGVARRDSVEDRAKALAKDDYVVLTFDPRGIAPSGGKWSAGGQKDIRDISNLIDFIAKRGTVQQDSSGNPRVGMEGVSGGGYRAIRAASQDKRIDAISGTITPYDVSTSVGENNVLKWPWAYFLYYAVRLDHVNPPDDLLEWTKKAMDEKEPITELVDFFETRSPKNGIGDVSSPTLVINGWHDRAFPPQQSFQIYDGLSSAAERRLIMVDFVAHDFGGSPTATDSEFATFRRARRDWLTKHLKGDNLPSDSPVAGDPIAFYHTQSDSFESYERFPQGERTFSLSESSGSGTTTLTTDGFARFDFPITSDFELAGVSHLVLNVQRQTGNPHLFAALADIPPDADRDIETMLIKDQIAATEVTSDELVELELNGVRHTVRGGHTLRIVLTLNDDDIAGINGRDPIFTDGLWIDSNTSASLTIEHSVESDSKLTITTK